MHSLLTVSVVEVIYIYHICVQCSMLFDKTPKVQLRDMQKELQNLMYLKKTVNEKIVCKYGTTILWILKDFYSTSSFVAA